MAMAGYLDDRYFANSMDILTMNVKALYKSRAIAAICARISALCLLYTILFFSLGFVRIKRGSENSGVIKFRG